MAAFRMVTSHHADSSHSPSSVVSFQWSGIFHLLIPLPSSTAAHYWWQQQQPSIIGCTLDEHWGLKFRNIWTFGTADCVQPLHKYTRKKSKREMLTQNKSKCEQRDSLTDYSTCLKLAIQSSSYNKAQCKKHHTAAHKNTKAWECCCTVSYSTQ